MFRSVASSLNFGLVAFALRYVRIDQHEAAARHRIVADLDDPAVWPRAFVARMVFVGVLNEAADLFLSVVSLAVFATRGEVTDVFGVGLVLRK